LKGFKISPQFSAVIKRGFFMVKKTGLFIIFTIVAISFLTYGCGRSYDSPTWTMPTFTPSPTVHLFVTANVTYGAPITTGMVILQLGSSSGALISGAQVYINGTQLTETSPGSGVYMNMLLSTIAAGSTVSLTITSTSGSATGTIIMPAIGAATVGTISGGATGSSFTANS
jgi:hypothetical protein